MFLFLLYNHYLLFAAYAVMTLQKYIKDLVWLYPT